MTLKIGKSPAAELLGADKELIIHSLKSPQKLSHSKDDCQEAIHKIGKQGEIVEVCQIATEIRGISRIFSKLYLSHFHRDAISLCFNTK